MRNTLRALLASVVLTLTFATGAQAQDVKVLVFHGPPDATTTPAVEAMQALGTANGFTVDATAAATDVNPDKLAGYRALVFLNTSGDLLNAEQEGAVKQFVEAGNGFLGIGSAAQGESGEWWDGLIGARPTSDSSADESSKLVVPGDRVHPATKELPLKWTRTDQWYEWADTVTGTVHVVARYRDEDAPAGDATNDGDNDTPISWCRDYSGGRSFYLGMGRTAASYGDEQFRAHLLGALQWTAGLSRANCKATINSSYKGTKIMSAGDPSAGLATSGESHGLSVADNGWVFYIGRGDCRTDAERGTLYPEGTPFARILDHANPRVGVGCGTVHIYDPEQADGSLNRGITLAGKLAVYGDGGTGNERVDQTNHKMEYGLLGVVADPKFSENGWIYLQYFPTFDPSSKPPGLGEDRRISKLSRPRISRFTVDRATKRLDLDSEKRIFEYDAQIYSCCHVGGGMGFDSEGNLYVTTGDTNSSQNEGSPATGPGGYSGNNPLAKCPEGPEVPSSAHCGPEPYSYQDARRTAGNTNDYNGKLLRLNPIEIPDDAPQPDVGVGSTYTLPDADSPNGPNLFDGTEGGGGKTKPEIYAMGLRNPSRLSIDPETDIPYSAWVGPDAGAPNVDWGPSTYENAAQLTRAGNYGWPYCMGNKQPYRDRLADGTARTENAAGYVSGGATEGATAGWYDCDNLRNDSPNNTGLVELPHETGTGMDAGTVRGNNLWYSRGNKGAANGCPDFPKAGDNGAPNYDAEPVQLCPYARDEGMTIMDGPVYRYQAGEDNSRRWPEYWSGRWFLHNNGGASIKHGLLLDPETAGEGGLPIYADSLRDVLDWEGSGAYMDSTFGTDGALYVQTYDGFFRAEAGVSLFRYDYVGGPSTPSAAPRATPLGNHEVQFDVGASGGVSYEWDFGDGERSTEPNPKHTYAEAKRYTAKLTVTYGDESTDARTVDVDVLAEPDTTAPTTKATLDPATPGAGGTYFGRVRVTLSAEDAPGGSGVDGIEYRVNETGDWQTYTAPITRVEPGDYVIEFRARDKTGNVEDPAGRVTFKIDVVRNCTPDYNDEFDGPELDEKWEVMNPDDEARSFVDGQLRLKVRNGDLIGDLTTAKNVLLQDAPDGNWQATTRIDVSTLTEEGEQTGLVLWQDDKTFAKITFIQKGEFQQWEWVATRDGESQIAAGERITVRPSEVYLRLTANGGGTYIAEGSTDGDTWTPIAGPITDLGAPESIKVGLKVSDRDDDNPDHYAGLHSFRVDCSDRMAPTTSQTLDPPVPDGEFGWYKQSPSLTLGVEDGKGEIDKFVYTVNDGPEQPYTGPITAPGEGDYVIRYHAVDKAGNAAPVKTTAFRVDSAAPKTTGTAAVGADSATVTLSSDDGSGSGTVLTEYRVDGGPWQTYERKPDPLFDGHPGSFAEWRHAGGGGFTLMGDDSGGMTPTGDALGMHWFPKPYGDFRLKLQFREGRADGFSNGGVFVRFPDPTQRPRVDECAKSGAAADDDAWAAIYCGHEIQLYDNPQGSEGQKTGSVYNFDLNPHSNIGEPKERGEWEDYEIEVVGQKYTIKRNGEVINEFENAPGLESSRDGDPSTTLRQFAQGYIGLQNHSAADVMQYRNVTVEDLSAGGVTAPTPFKVEGLGPHTVEVRSVDAAGHVEDKQVLEFKIGADAPPQPLPTPLQPVAPIPPASFDTPATFRLGSVGSRISRKTLTSRGVRVPVRCTGAMNGTAKLTVSTRDRKRLKLKRRTIDAEDVTCWGPHTARVTLKPSAAIRKALARKGGPKRVKLTLTVQMRTFGRPVTTSRKTVTLRR